MRDGTTAVEDPETHDKTFGAMLRRFRLAAGLSQEELANRARLSAVAISALERGTRQTPHRHTVTLLAGALLLDPAKRQRFENLAARVMRPRPGDTPGGVTNHNLPLCLTSLHGRDADLRLLTSLVEQRRLVTLCGVGGVGKTRLAIEVARRVRGEFADGAWLVEFDAVAEPASICAYIATVLAVAIGDDPPSPAGVWQALRARNALLVLDSCEPLADRLAPIVRDMLERCGQLHVLATSREPLRVPGERVQHVAPLALPPAIALFAERAADAGSSLASADEWRTQHSLAAICERLDGLPLAIELAAARTNVFTLDALAAQLADGFALLTNGARTAPARHQTLHATVAWSHALLSRPECVAFRRLAIFPSGWTLAGACEVCAGGTDVSAAGVPALLGSLIGKSLVVADHSRGEPRYRLLQTVQAYALERLVESGEREALAERHHAYLHALAGEPLNGALPVA